MGQVVRAFFDGYVLADDEASVRDLFLSQVYFGGSVWLVPQAADPDLYLALIELAWSHVTGGEPEPRGWGGLENGIATMMHRRIKDWHLMLRFTPDRERLIAETLLRDGWHGSFEELLATARRLAA